MAGDRLRARQQHRVGGAAAQGGVEARIAWLVVAAVCFSEPPVAASMSCTPHVVTSGAPFESGCPEPIQRAEECSESVLYLAEVPDYSAPAFSQAAEDRPRGCWWQEAPPDSDGVDQVYFNAQPPGESPVSCSENLRCICCQPGSGSPTLSTTTTTMTKTTTTTSRTCGALEVTSGWPGGLACPQPLESLEDCTRVGRMHPDILKDNLVAVVRSEKDRPRGCWWQPSQTGSSAGLFF
mmetsp:Transcript_85124/g.274070  ORF Transcript_85124/g.274070 Transcript_85124/m.274070 type:complete len:237 (+) Transcript_85124:98-808(+)